VRVLLLTTWEVPKSEEDLKKWREFNRQYFYERNEKYNVKASGWTDGTGKDYYMMEFESYDAYAKYMDDEELQRYFVQHCRLLNNVKMKTLREYL
jgi:hypothetical protein